MTWRNENTHRHQSNWNCTWAFRIAIGRNWRSHLSHLSQKRKTTKKNKNKTKHLRVDSISENTDIDTLQPTLWSKMELQFSIHSHLWKTYVSLSKLNLPPHNFTSDNMTTDVSVIQNHLSHEKKTKTGFNLFCKSSDWQSRLLAPVYLHFGKCKQICRSVVWARFWSAHLLELACTSGAHVPSSFKLIKKLERDTDKRHQRRLNLRATKTITSQTFKI